MTDTPASIDIHEEGPREGFQIEPGPVSSADKIRLIEALAETGLHHIQACSFINPRIVLGWETVGGLGGCPFAGQPKAAGNIATEELVLLCEDMGIASGVDLDALIEVGRMAEEIVGHQLPSELIHVGSLNAFRRNAA
jgi:isopropylmalate/homocitrate/citramalate synthase